MKLLQAGCGSLVATACSKAAKTNCCNYDIFIRVVAFRFILMACRTDNNELPYTASAVSRIPAAGLFFTTSSTVFAFTARQNNKF